MRLPRLRRSTADPPYAAVEAAVQRAIALLRGGAHSVRAYRAVFGSESTGTSTDAPEWRVLLAAWRLAEQSGAPLAPALDRFAHAIRSLARLSERREVLLSGPRSTIRLVSLLPVAAMLLGALLGFDPLRALAGAAGIAATAVGCLLLVLGVRWAQALAKRVSDAVWVAGWEFELLAVGVAGGAPPQTALRRAVDAVDADRVEWVRLESLGHDGAVARAIAEAQALGTSLGPALLAEAESSRARAQADLEQAAECLGVSVLLPLGVCVLPAFILLGVVPVLLAVLDGAGLGVA